jgi:hypothetical protein
VGSTDPKEVETGAKKIIFTTFISDAITKVTSKMLPRTWGRVLPVQAQRHSSFPDRSQADNAFSNQISHFVENDLERQLSNHLNRLNEYVLETYWKHPFMFLLYSC